MEVKSASQQQDGSGSAVPFFSSFAKVSLEVKHSKTKGRGLFTTKPVKKGDTVLHDTPLCSTLFQDNQSKPDNYSCSLCMAFIGSLHSQINYLSGETLQDLPGLDPSDSFLSSVVPCNISSTPQCTEVYCSERCRERAKSKYHKILCPDALHNPNLPLTPPLQTLLKYRELLIEEDLQHYYTALKIIIQLCLEDSESPLEKNFWRVPSAATEADITLQSPLSKLLPLYNAKNFFDEENYKEDEDDENEMKFFQESFKLISDALLELPGRTPLKLPEWFHLEFYGWLLGLLRLNSHSITIDSPLIEYLLLIQNFPQAPKKKALSTLYPILKKLHNQVPTSPTKDDNGIKLNWYKDLPHLNISALIPPSQGAGFFPRLALVNHSCVPNCKVKFFSDYSCSVVAKRNIANGEELTITYVDVDDTLVERVKELKHYGFQCTCNKCKAGK